MQGLMRGKYKLSKSLNVPLMQKYYKIKITAKKGNRNYGYRYKRIIA